MVNYSYNNNTSEVGPTWYHTDHLGSTNLLTDKEGGVIQHTEYYPYGETRVSEGEEISQYKFTGQEFDPETGLYYYCARYYDPVVARFISADTVVPDPLNPQAFNRYTYCLNNPLIYTDPTGHIFGIFLSFFITYNFTTKQWSYGFSAGSSYSYIPVRDVTTGIVSPSDTTSTSGGSTSEGEVTPASADIASGGSPSGGVATAQNPTQDEIDEIARYIYGETSGVRSGNSTDEELATARQHIAHVYINRTDAGREAGMHSASPNQNNPTEMAVWRDCQAAARAALTAGQDPTGGAMHYNIREATQISPQTRAHRVFGDVSTSYGPFSNAAGGGDVAVGPIYINTYTGRRGM